MDDRSGRFCVEVTLVGQVERSGPASHTTKRLIVDTGCPVEMILDERTLERLKLNVIEPKPSNFGWLSGYMVRVVMPDVDFDRQVPAYANAAVVKIARADGCDGLVGKPFLDRFHFDDNDVGRFCLQSWAEYHSLSTR
ncbi:MAG: hypothetical protein CO095_09030 [Armatimonadetes bacterium CG_4_9_14_3_um_filter_58_7]|nr:MAG: hypothetical protein CO095_09030 [Armatimonadetes bacterium CG_4_9_14_3_um_filter_58_7]